MDAAAFVCEVIPLPVAGPCVVFTRPIQPFYGHLPILRVYKTYFLMFQFIESSNFSIARKLRNIVVPSSLQHD